MTFPFFVLIVNTFRFSLTCFESKLITDVSIIIYTSSPLVSLRLAVSRTCVALPPQNPRRVLVLVKSEGNRHLGVRKRNKQAERTLRGCHRSGHGDQFVTSLSPSFDRSSKYEPANTVNQAIPPLAAMNTYNTG